MDYQIAQLNVARMLAPLETPLMAEFVAALEPVNALADESPGFVWRLQDDNGDATSIRVFDDAATLVNLSVWRDIESLRSFVYGDRHVAIMRRKHQWFAKQKGPHLVLWWIPSGRFPTAEEAASRLELLATLGPSARAFTFSRVFPPAVDD